MAATSRSSLSIQLLSSCLLLTFSFESKSLTSAKQLGPQQPSPWKRLPTNGGKMRNVNTDNQIPSGNALNSTIVEEKPVDMEIEVSKKFTVMRNNLANGFGGRHCLESAIHICDLRNFATSVTPPVTPCSLLRYFQNCMEDETNLCLEPDVILLKTSLKSLMSGFRANGKCHQMPLAFHEAWLNSGEGSAEECKPEATWACALQLVSDLKGLHDKTCDAILQFRNCIAMHTHTCGYKGARLLVDGTQGLVWAYKKAAFCK